MNVARLPYWRSAEQGQIATLKTTAYCRISENLQLANEKSMKNQSNEKSSPEKRFEANITDGKSVQTLHGSSEYRSSARQRGCLSVSEDYHTQDQSKSHLRKR
jgi:hypothetical protein